MPGPKIQKSPVASQATPLAEDFLKMLQGQLSSDAFGTGVGPLQRESGTALRQFVSALQNGNGGVSEGSAKLIQGLEASGGARIERGAADLREQGGITGNRFGSSLAQGEALFRSEANAELDQTIGGIQEQGRQFDSGQLLEAISQLFGQGQANTDTIGNFAQLGINPEETIISPSKTTQVVTGLTGLVNAASGFK